MFFLCLLLFLERPQSYQKKEKKIAAWEKISNEFKIDTLEELTTQISLDEIKSNDYNLNISRYISTSEPEKQIDLLVTNQQLQSIAKQIKQSKDVHNAFLRELGLPELP